MRQRLPPHFVQLVWEATHKSFWRRQALHDFLRRCGIAESFLATWIPDETKRDFLNRLFPRLESSDAGIRRINAIADSLAEQKSFPDLENWDETKRMKEEAHRAVSALRLYLSKQAEKAAADRSRTESRKRVAELREQQLRKQQDLSRLQDRLNALVSQQGTQEGGYAFQDWFYDLVSYFEMQHRRPYKTSGREIDGSITVGDTTYLSELKFQLSQVGAPDVDIFRRKTETKADNTMGIMVSMSGYTEPAIASASGERSPLLLIDYQHLYAVLGGVLRLDELVGRVRRSASQTGRAYHRLENLA